MIKEDNMRDKRIRVWIQKQFTAMRQDSMWSLWRQIRATGSPFVCVSHMGMQGRSICWRRIRITWCARHRQASVLITMRHRCSWETSHFPIVFQFGRMSRSNAILINTAWVRRSDRSMPFASCRALRRRIGQRALSCIRFWSTVLPTEIRPMMCWTMSTITLRLWADRSGIGTSCQMPILVWLSSMAEIWKESGRNYTIWKVWE